MNQEETTAPRSAKRTRNTLLLLVLLAGLLYLSRLGAVTFYEEDEPRFASAVRTMVQTGDYLTPRFNGKLRINKPILYYWLASATSHVVGVGEFGARLPSALLGIATVLMLFLFARRYGSERFAAIAAFAFATCVQVALVLARAATADMTFIFFLTAALLAFFRAYTEADQTAGRRYILLFWGALGFAALAKGPAALVLSGGIIGLFLILRGDLLRWLPRILAPSGLLLFAVVAVPWYAAALALHGETFYRGFFLAEHFGRYGGTADPHHGPVWYYLPVLLGMFYPWSFFLPAGLRSVGQERRGEAPLRLYALCWMAIIFGIFSFSGTKLPHYIAPLYPAAALLVAWAWDRRLAGEASRAWGLGGGALIFLGTALTVLLSRIGLNGAELARMTSGLVTGAEPRLVLFGVLFGGVGLLGGLLALRAPQRAAVAVRVMGALLVAALLWGSLAVAPVVARCWQDPIRHLAEDAAARAGENGQLAIYAIASSDVVYYSERTVAWLKRDEDAPRLLSLARRAPLYLITKPQKLEKLPAGLNLRELRREGAFVLLGPAEGATP